MPHRIIRSLLGTVLAGFLVGCAQSPQSVAPENVTIAVIDNGVNTNAPQFSEYSISQSTQNPTSPHGSMMLSLILGIGGESTPLPPSRVDVLSINLADHAAAEDPLADAVNTALDSDADLVSISMGVRIPSPALSTAALRADNQGVPLVAAAGNVGFMLPDYPARIPSVLAVGATDENGEFLPTSSRQCLDVSVIAQDIPSMGINGEDVHISGTSVAAARTTHWLATAILDGQQITPESLPDPINVDGDSTPYVTVMSEHDRHEKSNSCEKS